MAVTSELNTNSWAVVDWRGVVATNMTYDRASDLVTKLNDASTDPSLVITTAEAAARIKEKTA